MKESPAFTAFAGFETVLNPTQLYTVLALASKPCIEEHTIVPSSSSFFWNSALSGDCPHSNATETCGSGRPGSGSSSGARWEPWLPRCRGWCLPRLTVCSHAWRPKLFAPGGLRTDRRGNPHLKEPGTGLAKPCDGRGQRMDGLGHGCHPDRSALAATLELIVTSENWKIEVGHLPGGTRLLDRSILAGRASPAADITGVEQLYPEFAQADQNGP